MPKLRKIRQVLIAPGLALLNLFFWAGGLIPEAIGRICGYEEEEHYRSAFG